jgi:hypothetical protein
MNIESARIYSLIPNLYSLDSSCSLTPDPCPLFLEFCQ